MSRLRVAAAIVAVSMVLACSGCATSYATQYYKFSGTIVDSKSGAPVPRAAIYIAESTDDFFRPVRVYADEIRWYVGGVDISALVFRRPAENRYLFLMADDEGRFSTVWRHNVVVSGFLPVEMFKSTRQKHVSFVVGARGYADRVISLEHTAKGEAFASSEEPVRMTENALAHITLDAGKPGATKPKPIERAYLVAVELKGKPARFSSQSSLDELALLADTAGARVVGRTVQKLERIHAGHYVGKGKLAEIKAERGALDYSVVIFDDELSPSQQRTLEDVLKVKVLDRTALILDIFALHATSREGKLQVELAQMEYLLPRYRHLEINGLLAFSRVGVKGGGFAPADLNAVLADAFRNLQASLNCASGYCLIPQKKSLLSGSVNDNIIIGFRHGP
jgi:hypothetical protein